MASDSQKIEDIISYMTSLTEEGSKILGKYTLTIVNETDSISQNA